MGFYLITVIQGFFQHFSLWLGLHRNTWSKNNIFGRLILLLISQLHLLMFNKILKLTCAVIDNVGVGLIITFLLVDPVLIAETFKFSGSWSCIPWICKRNMLEATIEAPYPLQPQLIPLEPHNKHIQLHQFHRQTMSIWTKQT